MMMMMDGLELWKSNAVGEVIMKEEYGEVKGSTKQTGSVDTLYFCGYTDSVLARII